MNANHSRDCYLPSLLLLISWIAAIPVRAQINVGVLDAPLNLNHPKLAGKLDLEIMKTLFVTDSDGKSISWYDHNRLNYAKIKNLADNESTLRLQRQLAEAMLEHGTAVSLILMRDLDSVRLLHFAHLDEDWSVEGKRLTPTYLDYLMSAAFRDTLRNRYREITGSLHAQRVRVLNLSFGGSEDQALELIQSLSTKETRQKYGSKYRKFAHAWASTEVAELKNFISDNPDTVFVISAGNESLKVDPKSNTDCCSIRAPNLIRVGALEAGTLDLADFSNWSATHVDIAASGTLVEYPTEKGGRKFVNGTSFAAPQVGRRVSEIIAKTPSLTAEEAVRALLMNHTLYVPKLNRQVHNGLVLNTCSRAMSAGVSAY